MGFGDGLKSSALRIPGSVRYYFLLALACAVVFAVVAMPNFLEGRSIIWEYDGYSLYMNFFILEGEMLRSLFSSLFAGQIPDLSTYSFDSGYGADILATTAGCFNDPFNLTSMFCPPEYAEYLYEVLIFVRFYLAAVAFSIFCRYKGKARDATLIAAVCYVTSGFVVFWAVTWHANFLNVAILLPFILMGAEKIFSGGKPYVLVVAMSLSLLFSVYFSYMLILILLGYCLIKFLFSEGEKSPKRFFPLLLSFFAYILVAFLIAAVVVVPEVIMLTSMGRVGIEREDILLQPLSYYLYLPMTLVGTPLSAKGAYLGIVPTLLLGSFFFLKNKEGIPERKAWLVGLALCVVGVLIPFFGKAMNGFSYVSDRWMVILAFCSSYIVCLAVSELLSGKSLKVKGYLTFLAIYAFVLILTSFYLGSLRAVIVLVAFCVISLFVVMAIVRIPNRKVLCTTLLGLLVFGVGCTTFPYFSSWGSNYGGSYALNGEVSKSYKSNPIGLFASDVLPEWRVSQPRHYTYCNAALSAGVRGIDFYSSFYNQNVDDYRQALGLSDDNSNYKFIGSDSRVALDALAGAKYYLASEGEDGFVPEGYEKVVDKDGYTLYETDYALPLSFVCSDTISEQTLVALTPVERQEVMLSSLVLDSSRDDSSNEIEAKTTSYTEPLEIISTSGLSVENGSIEVKRKGATLSFRASVRDGVESYLTFSGLRYQPEKEQIGDIFDRKGSLAKKVGKTFKTLMSTSPSESNLTIDRGNYSRKIKLRTGMSAMYSGKEDWVINLGTSDEDADVVTITFQNKGTYSYESIELAYQPLSSVIDSVKKLEQGPTVSTICSGNNVQIETEAIKEGDYIYVSLPFSSGWTARLNGQLASIDKANIGFMAVRVQEDGPQVLDLTYETPGLRLGFIVSVFGVVAFMIMFGCFRVRGGKRRISAIRKGASK